MEKIKISFIIPSLEVGGAERMLVQLLRGFNREIFNLQVITLKSGGALENDVKEMGIQLISAEMDSVLNTFTGIFRLKKILNNTQTNLVFCWMYHANLLGGIAAKMADLPVLWSVRHDFLDPKLLKPSTIWVAKLSSYLSHRVPKKIIFCSESSMKEHLKIGYDEKKSQVIPNGFDTKYFKPDAETCISFRRELDIPSNALVVGRAGRFNPTKDHHSLIRAAGFIVDQIEQVYFIFCGQKVDDLNQELVNWLKEAGVVHQTRLLGEQSSMANFYSALDVFVSSSVSEAFPNVIGEAMSCEIPCVVTDVGDSALIVGVSGLIVPSGEPKKMAETIIKLLKDRNLRFEMGKAARKRIIKNFSIQNVVERYQQLILEIVK